MRFSLSPSRTTNSAPGIGETVSDTQPFDLFAVDEAREVFAGIYRCFGRSGLYQEDCKHARTPHRVSKLIGSALEAATSTMGFVQRLLSPAPATYSRISESLMPKKLWRRRGWRRASPTR